MPITIDDYLSWSAEHDRDPEHSDTRASYATELLKTTPTHPWPPEGTVYDPVQDSLV